MMSGHIRSLLLAARISCNENEAQRPAPPPPRFARFASSSGPPPPLSRGRKEPAPSQRDPRRSYVSGQLRIEKISLPYPPLATCFCLPLKKKGEAERRQTQGTTAASYGCGARSCGARTPDGVPPRLSPKGIIPSQRLGSGQASWDAVCTGVTRLRLSQSREAPPTPVIVPGD